MVSRFVQLTMNGNLGIRKGLPRVRARTAPEIVGSLFEGPLRVSLQSQIIIDRMEINSLDGFCELLPGLLTPMFLRISIDEETNDRIELNLFLAPFLKLPCNPK